MKKSVNSKSVKSEKIVNLFTSNLTGRQLISEKSESKKAVKNSLADYAATIDAEFNIVIKSTDRRSRNVANAAKGKYKTALQVIVNCFPYQNADGVLCCKRKNADGVRIWAEKKLTAAAARGIVRESLNNFIKFVGQPEIIRVTIDSPVE